MKKNVWNKEEDVSGSAASNFAIFAFYFFGGGWVDWGWSKVFFVAPVTTPDGDVTGTWSTPVHHW